MERERFRLIVAALIAIAAAIFAYSIFGGRHLPRDRDRLPTVPADGGISPARR